MLGGTSTLNAPAVPTTISPTSPRSPSATSSPSPEWPDAAGAVDATDTADAGRGADAGGLRVAVVAPPWFDVPPPAYGGIEALLADLVNGLSGHGYEVTLIGAGADNTAASRFVPIFDEPPSHLLGDASIEVVHAAAVARVLDNLDVDVVHDHSLAGPLLARSFTTPTVVTVHGPVTGTLRRYYRELGRDVSLVAISDAQRRHAPELNWVGRVHNGIDASSFPYREDKDDYVLFLGRLNPEKGPALAIDVARAAGRRIILAAKCNEPAERAYFTREIEPRLGPGVEWFGEADAAAKRELLSRASCLLFPIQWEEPFGMVMIEAMACGTPVVALRRGSVPEVVRHGETGVVLDDERDLPDALSRARDLDPAACRAHVRRAFDVSTMAAGYEAVYQRLVSELPDAPGPVRALAA